MFTAANLNVDESRVRRCAAGCNAKFAGEVRYQEPPQTGGTIFEALPLWKATSVLLQGPVAKDFGDGSFFVVCPTTTDAQLREMYAKQGGSSAFEEELKKAANPSNFS